MRGAYLEVLADTVGSIGVLIGGALILAFGWRWVDPVVAIAIGLFIVPRTIRLARTAIGILAQGAPPHLDLDEIRAALCALPTVREAHDVHVWTLTSGMDVASVHLATDAGGRLRRGAQQRAGPAARQVRAGPRDDPGGAGRRGRVPQQGDSPPHP